ncbi:MAG: S8 family serine peptidase, partial [Verrucomicrobiota bacterium]|nr:S8 family serine peptidase [Verrucomicrobiota bacterium]
MKDKILGWSVFAGILLVIGFAMYSSITKEAVVEEPTVDMPRGATSVAAEFGALGDDALKASTQPVATNSVSLDTAMGLEVLDERQTMQANGDIEHRRLVKRSGKYPRRIVLETLRRDRQAGKFVSVGRTEMAADHILVNLKAGTSLETLEELAASFNASVLQAIDEYTFMVKLEAPSLDAVEEAVGFFTEAASKVAYAEPDYVRYLSITPNDTELGQLWGLDKIQAPTAWDTATGSKDVVVAVIDTGMDMDHPDLVSNVWTNEGEIAGDGVDNDNNGYIDDVNGWNFVADTNNPEDDQSHGSHCAGTIGAVGNNANQVVGVCWSVSLMTLKSADATGLFVSDTSLAIRYAVDNGAKVLSNSYGGGGYSETDYNAILYAHNNGAIFVAAAGNGGIDGIGDDNDSIPQYPASYDVPNVISVAATDSNDVRAVFSNYGATSVDLAAPGVDVLSTVLDGTLGQKSGTSMACPHVAGAMALLVSTNPGILPGEAKQVLLGSVDLLPGLAGKVVSGGRLNLPALLADANDSDGDGMPDTWEISYGLDPFDPSDGGTNDLDLDFLANVGEYQNNCNPTNEDTDADSLI